MQNLQPSGVKVTPSRATALNTYLQVQRDNAEQVIMGVLNRLGTQAKLERVISEVLTVSPSLTEQDIIAVLFTKITAQRISLDARGRVIFC